jgi:transposase-like protein
MDGTDLSDETLVLDSGVAPGSSLMRDPRCPMCRSGNPRVVLATREVMRIRCTACGHSWSLDTPVSPEAPAQDRRDRPDAVA